MPLQQQLENSKAAEVKAQPTLPVVKRRRVLFPEAAKQQAVSLVDLPIQDMGDAARKEVLSGAGKEIASYLGAQLLLEMLAASGKSMRQVARESGFDVSVLSNIANGKRTSGPELWTLVALAEGMGLDLRLSFSKK